MKRKCLLYCINVHRPALNLNDKQPWHIFPHCQSLWCKTKTWILFRNICSFHVLSWMLTAPSSVLVDLVLPSQQERQQQFVLLGKKKLVLFVGFISEDLSPAHSTPTGFSGSCWLIHRLPAPLIVFLFFYYFFVRYRSLTTCAYFVPF